MTGRKETLARLLGEIAARCGDRTALVCEGEELSFTGLEERIARLAGGLARLGVRGGDRVAVWLPSSFAWVELEFALARIGAVAVAINTMFRSREVQDILSRSAARALVIQPGFEDIDFSEMVASLDFGQLPELRELISVGDEGDEDEALRHGLPTELHAVRYEELLSAQPVEEDLGEPGLPCNAFTSSGTTSAPKLILHSQSGVCKHAKAVAEAFPLARDPEAVVLGMLPFCGVFGFNTVMGAIAAGRPTVLMPAFGAGEAARLIEAHGVTFTNGSDEMLLRVLAAADPPSRIASLREAGFANFGADPRKLVAGGDALGKRFFGLYGSSEVQALMARQPADADPETRVRGGGVPVSGETELRVRDRESGELLPPGEAGELEIRGPSAMFGYINNPEAEKENITADGYVRSGDLCHLTEDGFVYLTRIGDALRLSGFLVSPREIEDFLEDLPGIATAQVVGAETDGRTKAVAFVVAEEGHEPDEEDVLNRCRGDLSKFKAPRRVIILEDFPTVESANGVKIKRNELREMAAESLREEKVEG